VIVALPRVMMTGLTLMVAAGMTVCGMVVRVVCAVAAAVDDDWAGGSAGDWTGAGFGVGVKFGGVDWTMTVTTCFLVARTVSVAASTTVVADTNADVEGTSEAARVEMVTVTQNGTGFVQVG